MTLPDKPQPTSSEVELLRRFVLTESDGFSQPILRLLQTMGYSGSWAKVTGNHLAVFIGGDGNGPVPEIGQRLQADIGGSIHSGWSPGDSWFEWHWTANP